MTDARNQILARIRGALKDVPGSEGPEEMAVARDYRRTGTGTRSELVEQFVGRLVDYKAKVHQVLEAELPAAIAGACAARGARRLVVPADLPTAWAPEGVELVRDEGLQALSNAQLDSIDGVLTGCALAIAQTGTIVLDGGPGQGRRAITLLPDYHLCVVRAGQIVDLVPEAIAQLKAAPGRPITFISGPSATSDIELNRVEGVHGPRSLEVLIASEA